MEQNSERAEIIRERNRLKKKASRQRQREQGVTVDILDKKRRVIQNICNGVKVRSDLKLLGITRSTLQCDDSQIHPDILSQLVGKCSSQTIVNELTEKPKKIRIRIKHNKISQAEINQIFDQLLTEQKISIKTCKNYKDIIGTIIRVMNCSPDDVLTCFREYEQFFKTMSKYYPIPTTYKNMLSPILSLVKFNDLIRKELDDHIIEKYHQEMNRLRDLVTKQEEDKVDNGAVRVWSDFVQFRKKLSTEEPDSKRFLILCLYTMLPPMRDNFGKVYLVTDGVGFPPEEKNVYFVETGRLLVTQYKTEKFGGDIDIIIPHKLQGIIKQSIMKHPRKYLITKEGSSSQVYDSNKGGKLSSIITGGYFDFSINDLRHSVETYIQQNYQSFSFAELKLIRYIMGHGALMSEMYARRASDKSEAYSDNLDPSDPLIIESIFHKIGGDQ